VIDDWEFFHGLATRMGFTLSLIPMINYMTPVPGAPAVQLSVDPRPTTDDLLEILCRGSRVSLDEIKRHPHGCAYPDPAVFVEAKEPGWAGRLDAGNPAMMDDLVALARRSLPDNTRRFVLISRRMMHVYNSSYNAPATNRGRAYNPVSMNHKISEIARCRPGSWWRSARSLGRRERWWWLMSRCASVACR